MKNKKIQFFIEINVKHQSAVYEETRRKEKEISSSTGEKVDVEKAVLATSAATSATSATPAATSAATPRENDGDDSLVADDGPRDRRDSPTEAARELLEKAARPSAMRKSLGGMTESESSSPADATWGPMAGMESAVAAAAEDAAGEILFP